MLANLQNIIELAEELITQSSKIEFAEANANQLDEFEENLETAEYLLKKTLSLSQVNLQKIS